MSSMSGPGVAVSTAQARTTAGMARREPNARTIARAIEAAAPPASISFPKIAPSRNTGKNARTYSAAPFMNDSVYPGRIGTPANARAAAAQIGAKTITGKPR